MNSEIFADYKDAVDREQLQEILGIGKSLAYKLLQSGEIKSKKLVENIEFQNNILLNIYKVIKIIKC